MLSFKIWILILCFGTIIVSDVINGSTSQSQRKTVKENISDPDNIKDPIKARSFFKKHGLLDESQNQVYSVIDSNTTITYAHGICKCVIDELLRGRQSLKRVEISYDGRILISDYKFEYMNMTRSNGELFYLYGAKCFYGDSKNDYLFICNSSKKPFYYVFSPHNNNQLNIKACLKIIPKDSDFPEIIVKETTDNKIADSIFAKHNPPSVKVNYHVCSIQKIGKQLVMRGKDVCEKLLMRQDKLNRKIIKTYTDVSANCEKHQITRQILTGNAEFVKSVKYSGVVCSYKDLQENGKFKSLLILNAPKKGFYYVAKEETLSDPALGSTQLPIGWLINSCVQLAEPE